MLPLISEGALFKYLFPKTEERVTKLVLILVTSTPVTKAREKLAESIEIPGIGKDGKEN